MHAQHLIEWLRARSDTRELRFPEILWAYHRMCDERGMVARPWNPVAAAFTKLTSGPKTYRWFRIADGSKHRLRVYRISVAPEPHATHTAVEVPASTAPALSPASGKSRAVQATTP